MKKFILLTLIAFFAMSCEVKMQGANANDNTRYGRYVFSVSYQNYDIRYNTIEIDSMTYAVFGGATPAHYGGVSVSVVNLTKDKLEVELLKRQLKK